MQNRHSDLRNDCLYPKNQFRLNFLINFKVFLLKSVKLNYNSNFYARGKNTKLYTALWHQRAVYPPVMPGTTHVLLM